MHTIILKIYFTYKCIKMIVITLCCSFTGYILHYTNYQLASKPHHSFLEYDEYNTLSTTQMSKITVSNMIYIFCFYRAKANLKTFPTSFKSSFAVLHNIPNIPSS